MIAAVAFTVTLALTLAAYLLTVERPRDKERP